MDRARAAARVVNVEAIYTHSDRAVIPQMACSVFGQVRVAFKILVRSEMTAPTSFDQNGFPANIHTLKE